MIRTRRQTALFSALQFLLFLLPVAVNGQSVFLSLFSRFFSFLASPCNQNPSAERCGFGYVMRTGTDGTYDCTSTCVFFPVLAAGKQCGSCTAPPPSAPVPAPNPSPSGTFEITVDLVGSTSSLTQSQINSLVNSKKRWEQIISADLPNVLSSTLPNGPPFVGCRYPTVIDDLYLCVEVSPIDGTGQNGRNTLGFASPDYERLGGGLGTTSVGHVKLDIADVKLLLDSGSFADVFLHEIGHVLGIGTYFVAKGITGTDAQKCPYKAVHASAEYKKISGCSVVPMETSGSSGDGTYCSHWDEDCLKNELMTGTLNLGGPNPLSRITIGALEDMGYPVTYSFADSYTASSLGTGCSCRRRLTQNGESFLLSKSRELSEDSKTRRRTQLSDETRQFAIQQGLKFLQETSPRVPAGGVASMTNQSASDEMNGVRYVGDQMVSVLVQDGSDGDIYSVHVYNPDYFPQ
jgi:Leishmanolysin